MLTIVLAPKSMTFGDLDSKHQAEILADDGKSKFILYN